jgi:hypothetical protein
LERPCEEVTVQTEASGRLAEVEPMGKLREITATFFCPMCGNKVSALVMVPPDEQKQIIPDKNADIKVMHMAPEGGDHIWSLADDEKSNLRKLFAQDLL